MSHRITIAASAEDQFRGLPARDRATLRAAVEARLCERPTSPTDAVKLKVWRIAADKYRGPRRRHTLVYKDVAGLHDLTSA